MTRKLPCIYLILLATSVLLLSFTVSAQYDSKDVSEKLFRLRADRKHDEAIQYLDSLIAIYPEAPELYSRRAEFKVLKGAATEDAIADATCAVKLKPDEPSYYLERARIYSAAASRPPYFTGPDYLAAMKQDIRTALSIEPVAVNTFIRGTEQLEYAMQWTEALQLADKFLDRKEFTYSAYTIRYKSKFKLKDYKGSLEDAVRTVELIPVLWPGDEKYATRRIIYGSDKEFSVIEPILRVHLKDAIDIRKLYDRAIMVFERAHEDFLKDPFPNPRIPTGTILYGTSPATHVSGLIQNYAKVLEEKGQFDDSEKQLDKLVTLTPMWLGLNLRAKFYEKSVV